MANVQNVTGATPVEPLRRLPAPLPQTADPAATVQDRSDVQLSELERSAQAQEKKWAAQAESGPKKSVVGIITGDAWVKSGFVYLEEVAQSVLAAEGVPRLIFPGRGDGPAQMDGIDALLVPGGGNADPAFYGQQQSPNLVDRSLDPVLDKFEMECVAEGFKREMPMLGICRGMQFMNIAPVPSKTGGPLPVGFKDVRLPDGVQWAPGGTLIQDIVHEHPNAPKVLDHWNQEKVDHRELRRFADHGVSIDPSSRMGKILGPNVEMVNSIHRQCIGVVSPIMAVVAWAPDGVPEAMVRKDVPQQMGTQWHPEWQRLDDRRMQLLFDTLVDDGARYKKGEIGAFTRATTRT